LESQTQKIQSLLRSFGRVMVLLNTASWWRKAVLDGELPVAAAEEGEESKHLK
jgi:hypothetical protein